MGVFHSFPLLLMVFAPIPLFHVFVSRHRSRPYRVLCAHQRLWIPGKMRNNLTSSNLRYFYARSPPVYALFLVPISSSPPSDRLDMRRENPGYSIQ
uniref:Uncharacterized protein n=1 Tax=Picea glauca TaxID=3330 RepID=A0A101LZ08_PICGL|nr:hypothetical protein ABT39_MTgene4961 [Picea glauca]QHR90393.1 hypothetical protein Q903MT_gene4416 [Picea sitchensis]